ncbi:hypothetical protein SGRIM119S_02321 [Streptomyces griseorubiginosus]
MPGRCSDGAHGGPPAHRQWRRRSGRHAHRADVARRDVTHNASKIPYGLFSAMRNRMSCTSAGTVAPPPRPHLCPGPTAEVRCWLVHHRSTIMAPPGAFGRCAWARTPNCSSPWWRRTVRRRVPGPCAAGARCCTPAGTGPFGTVKRTGSGATRPRANAERSAARSAAIVRPDPPERGGGRGVRAPHTRQGRGRPTTAGARRPTFAPPPLVLERGDGPVSDWVPSAAASPVPRRARCRRPAPGGSPPRSAWRRRTACRCSPGRTAGSALPHNRRPWSA